MADRVAVLGAAGYIGRAAPPAHLVLEERADPQPRRLATERDRRANEAIAADIAAGVRDGAQVPHGIVEQDPPATSEIADPGS
jgi:hypothetical protein